MSDALFGQAVRLRYLEAKLFTQGWVNTTTLKTLGITRQQASADINEYQRIAGNALRYDESRKAYMLDSRFKPRLLTKAQLQVFADSVDLICILTPKPTLTKY